MPRRPDSDLRPAVDAESTGSACNRMPRPPQCEHGVENETATCDLVGATNLVHIFIFGILWHSNALLTPNDLELSHSRLGM